MPWNERQQAMLQAMGLRVWNAAEAGEAEAVAVEAGDVRDTDDDDEPWVDASTEADAMAEQAWAAAPAPVPAARAPAAAAPVAKPAPLREVLVRGDIATLDWPALRESVAACTACGLCESRTQTVFGVGHQQAQWMVVGEAPGENEDLKGEPFVGASGELLDRMLAALQLTRSSEGDRPVAQRVYIANTLKCRPPRNRNPTTEEMAQCEPYLVRQIELLQPRIILAMGRFAVQALLRTDEPIGKLRGRVHRYQGVPVVVTYHPSYLLRSLQEKAKAWDDLCLAAETAERIS